MVTMDTDLRRLSELFEPNLACDFDLEPPAFAEGRQVAEPDEDVPTPAIPGEGDDAAWQELEDEAQRILAGEAREFVLDEDLRELAEFFDAEPRTFARPYNYDRKREQVGNTYRTKMGLFAADLREGRLGWKDWAYRSQLLVMTHVAAGYTLGLAEAKGVVPSKVKLGPVDRARVASLTAEQFEYFGRFARQVASIIVAGDVLTTGVDARARLYGGAFKAAASEAQVASLPEDEELVWIRYASDSCDTCIGNEGRVQTAAEWGEGGVLPAHNTICDGNCRCKLLPVGGREATEPTVFFDQSLRR